jgi:hypothetical protein
MTAPAWAPDLPAIGAYVTSRTLDNATPGDATPTGTFTEDTYPTDAQVEGLIPGVCGWITAITGTIDSTLYDLATATAALRVAALVELSFPVRDADVTNAEQLLAQADAARADLAAANVAITGTNPHTAPLVPTWSMPKPLWYGDLNHLGS